MSVPKFIAKQLGRPSGWFGRYVTAPVLNRRNAPHNALVLSALEIKPNDRVLEVGFGGAALLERLSAELTSGTVAGVEISEEMLASAAKRLRKPIGAGRIVLRRGSVEALPFGGGEFDKACTVNTTYFWPDLAAGLAELHRVLRPGGRLVIGYVPPDDLVRAGLHKHGFALHSTEQLADALRAASFTVGPERSAPGDQRTLRAVAAEREGV